MNIQTVQAATFLTLENFQERVINDPQVRVIMIYPWHPIRSPYLTLMLEAVGDDLLYTRVAEADPTLQSWLRALVAELKDSVDSKFGAALTGALKGGNKPVKWAEALAEDLAALKRKRSILYVDELDKLPTDGNLDKFLRALVSGLPKGMQLAVSSRRLNYEPWYTFRAEGIATVLGTEMRKDDGIFTPDDTNRPQLEVYAFGRGHVLVNGSLVDNWDGALPRNLFFYFMDNTLVTRDQIFQVFWPDLNVKEATNVFHVTKRKITERLSMRVEGGGNFEMTQYANGFYVPSQKLRRHYDVADFQEAVEKALLSGDDAEEERLFLQAVELYRGPFLQDIDMEWMVTRRDQLRQMYAHALIGLGRLYKRRGELERSLGYFARSLTETPEREDIHREVMQLYLKMNRPHDARRQYDALVSMLLTSLGINPSRETQELVQLIKI